jgi:hypothetical protein
MSFEKMLTLLSVKALGQPKFDCICGSQGLEKINLCLNLELFYLTPFHFQEWEMVSC